VKKVESKELFKDVSKDYSDLYDQFNRNIRKHFVSNILDKENINRVLDVGNGGTNPEDILSEDITKKLGLFVGNDSSFDMLTRIKRSIGVSVNSDALSLPFKKESFDTILIMSLIHHIGFSSEEKDLYCRLRIFLKELIPLLEEGGCVYIIESTLPRFLERVERYLYLPLYTKVLRKKFIPTFMFCSCDLQNILNEYFDYDILEYKWVYRLFDSKWEMMAPTLYFKWLKLPVVFSPFKILFYKCRPKKSRYIYGR
jgi:SAM-dependent methyltransferase|tara:strand:+ start:798 stop:1562 length:765 start_codon:yes stop_codon:yes gene_type:complete